MHRDLKLGKGTITIEALGNRDRGHGFLIHNGVSLVPEVGIGVGSTECIRKDHAFTRDMWEHKAGFCLGCFIPHCSAARRQQLVTGAA